MPGRNVVGLVLVVAVFFVASALAVPQWPLQWQSEFNFVNVSNRVLLNYGSYHFKSDGKTTQLRIDNFNCPVGDRSFFCRVIFARDTNCYLYAPERNNLCCLLVPGLLATGPNWLHNATFLGIKEYQHQKTNAWLNTPNKDIYYETLKTKTAASDPVALADSSTALEWNTFRRGAQSDSLFAMPRDGSCQKPCHFSRTVELPLVPFISAQ
ncbi:uncharacterized protein ACA1_076420 [Acanthamoeba castellanii str. Neff]|uniref:Uncharacterized protein n=1 Tax=Acanthamoeba castellanii (strain ATCC 30010 / Neff) TaxID=1257118 RepID=L8GLS3_ACACF|nr:uncharacterized protein ACA1_076420 [Acanthamoeba castellanii str. Neff]ELR13789.1 hypothetical protein ACA1_076420 [Acanthamoeba castellanii str. Neff]